jgi:hypothetical protein
VPPGVMTSEFGYSPFQKASLWIASTVLSNGTTLRCVPSGVDRMGTQFGHPCLGLGRQAAWLRGAEPARRRRPAGAVLRDTGDGDGPDDHAGSLSLPQFAAGGVVDRQQDSFGCMFARFAPSNYVGSAGNKNPLYFPRTRGEIFFYNSAVAAADIRDGMSSTLLVGERSRDLNVPTSRQYT